MNHADVCKKFVEGSTKYTTRGNVLIRGNTLCSYGEHFVLCWRRPDGIFVVNGDSRSVSTSRHQRQINTALRGKNTVVLSATMLSMRRVDPMTMEIIHSTPAQGATWNSWDAERQSLEDFKKTIPLGTRVHTHKSSDGFISQMSWHRPGGTLIKHDGKFILFSMDEGSFFSCVCPREVGTVGEAFDSLKPDAVRQWEQENNQSAPRQGEWFFLPVDFPEGVKKKDTQSRYVIWNRDWTEIPWGWGAPHHHIAGRGIKLADGRQIVSGTVSHRQPRAPRGAYGEGEHAPLKLSLAGKQWFEAHENLATDSRSVSGID